MMHGFGSGYNWWGMMLMMVVFWGAVIWLFAWLVKMLAAPRQSGGSSSARAILDERYAKGELNRCEYESMRKDIGT
jgi:putative membrane protein